MLWHSKKKEERKRKVVNYKGECYKAECPLNFIIIIHCHLFEMCLLQKLNIYIMYFFRIVLSINFLVSPEYIYNSLEK